MTDMPTVEPTGVPKVYSGNRGRYRNSVEVRGGSGSTQACGTKIRTLGPEERPWLAEMRALVTG